LPSIFVSPLEGNLLCNQRFEIMVFPNFELSTMERHGWAVIRNFTHIGKAVIRHFSHIGKAVIRNFSDNAKAVIRNFSDSGKAVIRYFLIRQEMKMFEEIHPCLSIVDN
jgi:hypothetical protein